MNTSNTAESERQSKASIHGSWRDEIRLHYGSVAQRKKKLLRRDLVEGPVEAAGRDRLRVQALLMHDVPGLEGALVRQVSQGVLKRHQRSCINSSTNTSFLRTRRQSWNFISLFLRGTALTY